ncbi:hypothetical protein GCM10009687_63300 [Asanoa iriomotensis]|uniref:Uncharacterized protein n=1 Tax=Asanoa iriomotensis TaxID=234613 RepID=A0ABQ4C4D9_9ACTN|nr:hypothetical protein Air01nite_37240 [Asanoa iriomotensis]
MLNRAASVQFGGSNAILARVIRCHDWPTYEGWCWLDVYQLTVTGDAVERRSVFVRVAGLRTIVGPAKRGRVR